MKKYYIKLYIIILSLSVSLFSCDLDINDNPNSPTAAVVTPDLVLPAVIASTVYNKAYYYDYGFANFLIGYQLPGAGISGYGDDYTYNYSSSSKTGAWTSIFADLRDYQSVIKAADSDPQYALFGAVSQIFRVISFQLLVDNYGNVPYTEALQGAEGNLAPKYDDATEIYKALVGEIDNAIKTIKDSEGSIGAGVIALNSSTDPVFSGNTEKWIKFANNIKLRLLIRAKGTSIDSFVQSAFQTFDGGFLTDDVLVNPGYNASSQQNPVWTVFHSSVAGTITYPANYYIPSKYTFSFYNGGKLNDPIRGKLVYKGFSSTPVGQLGDPENNPATSKYAWFVGTGTGKTASDAQGIFKSRSAGAPLFTAAETYFLLAEAALYGYELSGDLKTNFKNGIEASFRYLEKFGSALSIPAGYDPAADASSYITLNTTSYLANIDIATTTEQKLEAIITQKYIALNNIDAQEAWAEFRRTAYPKISGTDASTTFVSIQSTSTREDKLPVRLIYPQAEYSLNRNTPSLKNAFSDPVFWDKN